MDRLLRISNRSKRWLLGISVLGMAILGNGCARLADRMLLYPSRRPIPTDAERIEVQHAGATLELYRQQFGPAGEPEFYVLALCGNADRAERWADRSARLLQSACEANRSSRRFEVYALNYPGFGRSTGRASLAKLGPSAIRSLQMLKAVAGSKPILIHATSIGTTAALDLAASESTMRRVGLLLEKPPSLRAQILRDYGWWNLWLIAAPIAWSLPDAARSDLNVRQSHLPAVFLYAQNDEVVPPVYVHELFDAYAGPKRIAGVGGKHGTEITRENCPPLTELMDWLFQQVSGGGPTGIRSNLPSGATSSTPAAAH